MINKKLSISDIQKYIPAVPNFSHLNPNNKKRDIVDLINGKMTPPPDLYSQEPDLPTIKQNYIGTVKTAVGSKVIYISL